MRRAATTRTSAGRRQQVAVVTGSVIVAALALAGCSAHAATGSGTAPGAGAVLVGDVTDVHLDGVTAQQIGTDTSTFGLGLYQKLCAADPTENVVLSPASAVQAVGMLEAGAAPSTQTGISAVLHEPGWSAAVIAAIRAQSTSLHGLTQIAVSNRLFEQQGVRPTVSTRNAITTAYDADLRVVNFADEPATTNLVNGLVSHDTRGLIPHLFDTPFHASVQTVLTDAIYLHADWVQPFPPATLGTFFTAAGATITTPLLTGPMSGQDFEQADGWTSITLPYAGNQLDAVAMLPPATADSCATPTPATLSTLTAASDSTATVTLPTLSLSSTFDNLSSTLTAMGMPLSGAFPGYGGLQVSQIVQKATLRLDSKGTTAAAATGVALTTGAEVSSRTVSFTRPFLLLLRDTATRTPLFLVHVTNPSQG